MEQKALSKWLRFIMIGVGICGLVIYCVVVPVVGQELTEQYPEFAGAYLPWVVFLWITAVPCYAVLFFGWRIAGRIGKDRSFCMENATDLKRVSVLAAGDSVFYFAMNVVYLFLGWNHPGMLLASLIVTFLGVAVTVAAAVLSHLVQKAAKLQEDSDLTI